jgi:hypothetical protein
MRTPLCRAGEGHAGPTTQNAQMVVYGWIVLALVFVDELLAVVALGVSGWSASPRWLLVWLLPVLAILVWSLFASPKARFGTPVLRPVAKVVVFGSAALGLWWAGHRLPAAALLVFSLVTNLLAMAPSIRGLARGRSA